MTLRAQVNYRRLNQEYTNYVLSRQKRKLTVPVVQMATSEVYIGNSHRGRRRLKEKDEKTLSPVSANSVAPLWKRWNDYGIGLFEQAQYGQAADAFRRASELAPDDPNLIVNIALAEMKTERFGPEHTQYIKAAALLEQTFRLDPQHERARFYRALIWRSDGKMREAAEELEALSLAYPRDREVLRELAQTRYAIGQLSVAGDLFRRILAIDPTDAGAYQHLDPIYLSEGKKYESMWAREKYLLWRDDPKAEAIAARFFAAHPEWADERVGAHVHGENSARRPVLIGAMATPDK
jgi:Flp pilus assembly protein TadD